MAVEPESRPDRNSLTAVAAKLQIGSYHRHVLLCVESACAPAGVGLAAWDALKAELKARGLAPGTASNTCYRTKVGCLRVCQDGPIAVVYPEGTFYCHLTAERIPEFVQRHLIEGQPLDELVFARNPLPFVDNASV